MRAPRSGTRGRGKRLGRRPDGRRAARRPCHPQKTSVEICCLEQCRSDAESPGPFGSGVGQRCRGGPQSDGKHALHHQGLPPEVDCGGGRGYRRCWADLMAGLANASTMGLTSRRGHGGRCGGRGNPFPLRPSRSAGPVRHDGPGSARPSADHGFPGLRASCSLCWSALGPPVGSSSFALSLPTGPQVPFSDKRKAPFPVRSPGRWPPRLPLGWRRCAPTGRRPDWRRCLA